MHICFRGRLWSKFISICKVRSFTDSVVYVLSIINSVVVKYLIWAWLWRIRSWFHRVSASLSNWQDSERGLFCTESQRGLNLKWTSDHPLTTVPLGGEITCLNLICWKFSNKKYLTLSYFLQHIQDLHTGLFQKRVIAQNETWATKREKGNREFLWHTCKSQTFGLLMRLRLIKQDLPQVKEHFIFVLILFWWAEKQLSKEIWSK